MKKTKDESPLSAFDDAFGSFSNSHSVIPSDSINLDSSNINYDNDDDEVIDLSVKQKKDNTDLTPSTKDEPGDAAINDATLNDNDEVEEEVDEQDTSASKTKKTNKKDVDVHDETDENNEPNEDGDESGQVGLFFDAFSESLGWDVDSDEEKPTTIEGLIDYMKDVIEENSSPDYANDKVKELDEYIKNGGNFDDYYKLNGQIEDLKNIDMEDESVQKTVCKKWLKLSGYTDTQISKKIQRWEDAGVLEDEANDSLELLTEHEDKNKAEAINKQKAAKIQQDKAQETFYTEVINTIDNLKDIRGIKIPVEDRKKLKDYAFKVESDGRTKYQKEYANNVSKNFIESAYFTMKGDAFTKSAKQAGESSAVAKLRQTMKNRTPGNSKHDMDNSSATPIWKAASSFFGVRS